MDQNEWEHAKILIVDDELINLTILEELLEQAGYSDIVCEEDPEQAIQHYQQQEFDLVLLDLNMPKISGFGVMEAFKEHVINVPPPILVLTALTDKSTKIRALSSGASDFLTKPFDHDEVHIRVDNLIKLQFAQKQLYAQNEILEHKVQVRTQQLHEANLEAISRLGLVADFRDTETGEHTQRVGLVSKILGLALGLDDAYCETLLHAAPMHDIGKVGIPDSILLKPGKLDAQEWEIMKKHTTIGAQVLEGSSSEILQMAHEVALTHHEKWDGSGYPAGIKGSDIPMSGRIVIVADIFDALSSDRPYKKAWSEEEILNYMKEQRSTMFDPEVLDKFIDNFDEISSVRANLSNAKTIDAGGAVDV